MAYDQKFPTDDGYLADFPPGMREQIRAIVEDMVVNALALQGLTPGNASGNIPVSNGTKCTNLNAELHGGNLPSAYAVAGHVHSIATDSSNGLMSNTDKTKLDGIATGAKVNQNAFSNILVGTTTIQADSETDTLEIVAGTNVSIVPDATNDRITINNTYAHPTGDGNIHVPATGTANSGKVLTAGAAAGSLSWTTPVDATKAPINHSSTATTYGISSATEYGHAMASSATPLAAGTAAVGTDNGKFAREGHVHPAQTTITGNAATATILQTARTISGVSFNGSSDITIPYSGLSGLPMIPSATAYDTAHSFNANGYQRLSNGLIIQWGRWVGGAIAPNGGSLDITFPVTFPADIGASIVQIVECSPSNGSVQIEAVATTQSNLRIFNKDGDSAITQIRWFAIGF